MKKTVWFVYIIQGENGAYYTGITTDLERRFSEHQGQKKKAKFFNTTLPRAIVFKEEFPNRSLASKREAEIKKLRRKQKEDLINSEGEK